MKQVFLTKEQILISIDRLTRFKNPKEKYYRVFYDIILSCLSGEKLKKNDLIKKTPEEILSLAQEVLNTSIHKFVKKTDKFYINNIIKEYENSIYNCDSDVNILLDNTIDYGAIIELIDDDSPINLKWLKSLKSKINIYKHRRENCLKFPIEKVVLVEGLTEEILLPAFSRLLDFDFYKEGIQIIPAGGKNQVVKMYYQMAEELKIPIFILLDNDAKDNISQIEPKLRQIDRIHLISCGEFEDLLPKSLIVKSINNDLENFDSVSENDLSENSSEVENLENIFKQKGLHDFKKADFAKLVRKNLDKNCEISEEIREIIDEIRKFH